MYRCCVDGKTSCRVVGIGTVLRKVFDDVVKTLGNVRHVPDLKKSMISLSILESKEYMHISEGRILKISKGTCIIMREKSSSTKLFVVGFYHHK